MAIPNSARLAERGNPGAIREMRENRRRGHRMAKLSPTEWDSVTKQLMHLASQYEEAKAKKDRTSDTDPADRKREK